MTVFEKAVQGFQDNGKPFEDGAGGTAATQTKEANCGSYETS